MIQEAFISHADAKYMRLSEVLVRGLAHFSTRPVVVYGINTDVDYDAPNVIKRRIDCQDSQLYTIKFRILLDSGIEHGVYLDADNVPNRDVDRLFAACGQVGTYPLVPRHPSELGHLEGELMAELGVRKQSMPFVHSCCIAFSHACKPFLQECDRVSQDLVRRVPDKIGGDEPVMNVLLWKINATRYLDSCNIHWRFFDSYIDNSSSRNAEFLHCYGGYPFCFYTFHYCKDPEQARHMLQGLMARHQPRG